MIMDLIGGQRKMRTLRPQNQTLDICFAHRVFGVVRTAAAVAAAHGPLVVVREAKVPGLAGGQTERVFELLVPASETLKGAGGVA